MVEGGPCHRRGCWESCLKVVTLDIQCDDGKIYRKPEKSGWWFGTFFFHHIYNIIIYIIYNIIYIYIIPFPFTDSIIFQDGEIAPPSSLNRWVKAPWGNPWIFPGAIHCCDRISFDGASEATKQPISVGCLCISQ